MKTCIHCGIIIPERRVQVLPHTRTCVNCSTEQKKHGVTIITGKSEYSQIQIVDEATAIDFNAKQQRRGLVSNGAIMGGKTSVMAQYDTKLKRK